MHGNMDPVVVDLFPPGSFQWWATLPFYEHFNPNVIPIQDVVSAAELKDRLSAGWQFVYELNSGSVVVQYNLNLTGVTSPEDLEARVKPLGIKTNEHKAPPPGAQVRPMMISGWPPGKSVTVCFFFGSRYYCFTFYQVGTHGSGPPNP